MPRIQNLVGKMPIFVALFILSGTSFGEPCVSTVLNIVVFYSLHKCCCFLAQ